MDIFHQAKACNKRLSVFHFDTCWVHEKKPLLKFELYAVWVYVCLCSMWRRLWFAVISLQHRSTHSTCLRCMCAPWVFVSSTQNQCFASAFLWLAHWNGLVLFFHFRVVSILQKNNVSLQFSAKKISRRERKCLFYIEMQFFLSVPFVLDFLYLQFVLFFSISL